MFPSCLAAWNSLENGVAQYFSTPSSVSHLYRPLKPLDSCSEVITYKTELYDFISAWFSFIKSVVVQVMPSVVRMKYGYDFLGLGCPWGLEKCIARNVVDAPARKEIKYLRHMKIWVITPHCNNSFSQTPILLKEVQLKRFILFRKSRPSLCLYIYQWLGFFVIIMKYSDT